MEKGEEMEREKNREGEETERERNIEKGRNRER